MGFSCNIPEYKILNSKELQNISEFSFRILSEIGVKVPHEVILNIIQDYNGSYVDKENKIVKFSEDLIQKALKISNKKHILYGRNRNNKAEFGYNMFNFNGSSGQYQIVDHLNNVRRSPNLNDLKNAIILGDALDYINIVGALVIPSDVPAEISDIVVFYHLITLTSKPFTGWVFSGKSARKIIEMMEIISGSKKELREHPFYEVYIEPISPLMFRKESLDILIEFANASLPVGFSPMVQLGATGPCSLVGTIIQENAEILAGIVISQLIKPGLSVSYGGIPHVFDMKSQMISFGSPEQAILASAMTQLGKFYGFPVYNNTGMSDSKCIDAQYGIEASGTLAFGMLSGGDVFGHLGILGADNAASLIQLTIDNEIAGYYVKIFSGFDIDEIGKAYEEIYKEGIGGNFFGNKLTLENFRKVIWYPELLDRAPWDTWEHYGRKSITNRAKVKMENILKNHFTLPIDDYVLKYLNEFLKKNNINI